VTQLVDSHCHLDLMDLTKFPGGIDGVIRRANEHDVDYFLCVAIHLNHVPQLISIADNYEHVFASVGLHPNETPDVVVTEAELVGLAQSDSIIAVGETGLDYYRSEGDLAWQQQRFRTHIAAAKQCGKSLIIHTRQAPDDTIQIMTEENASEVGGVMHCFTEDWTMAKAALDLGFYISFSGVVTFKNAKQVQEVATKMPLDRMLVETDCPYLAPVPFRGKPNEPAYTKYTAEHIAQLRGITYDEVAEATTDNFFSCFPKATRSAK
jgi:TatD DNase family protein